MNDIILKQFWVNEKGNHSDKKINKDNRESTVKKCLQSVFVEFASRDRLKKARKSGKKGFKGNKRAKTIDNKRVTRK
ncbi:hypothetical protein [Streptococcus pluranimalium]|uniref:hypothetical protein n=1 Tax=Streptococcus pluranimalium TaxID=82348 RepID=UPI003F6696E6